MRTDMMSHSSRCLRAFPDGPVSNLHAAHAIKVQNKLLSAIPLTTVFADLYENSPLALQKRWLMSGYGTNRRAIHYQLVNLLG
jgi:hypothetical protein